MMSESTVSKRASEEGESSQPPKKRTKTDSKEVTKQIQGWLKARCDIAQGKKVGSAELRFLCEQELGLSFTSIHFGRALRSTYPNTKTGNRVVSDGCNKQFIYGVAIKKQSHSQARPVPDVSVQCSISEDEIQQQPTVSDAGTHCSLADDAANAVAADLRRTIKAKEQEVEEMRQIIEAQRAEIEQLNEKVRQIRPRSTRVSATDLRRKKQETIVEAVLENREDGLKMVEIEGKGRGVVATRPFKRRDFVVSYSGDLISPHEAEIRELKYVKSGEGSYMFYLKYQDRPYCIDATAESGLLGRLVNHSRTNGNCFMQVLGISDRPHLILVAKKTIKTGEEVLYDYGDRNADNIKVHPWLAK